MPCDLYKDDSSIQNQADLWRRILPWHFVADENQGGLRPSSAAFENDPDAKPMSVFVEDLVREAGKDERDVLAGHRDFALASLTAGFARQQKQGVALEPTDFPGHAVVFGEKTKSVRRAFAKSAKWVVAPTGAS
jgi:hypothetical protein